MSLDYIIEPLPDRDWLRPDAQRKPSVFKVSWANTLRDLETEIDHLRGKDVTIHLDVVDAAIRRDRTALLKDQMPASPAVAVSFDTRKHGRLTWRCDRYETPSYYGSGGHGMDASHLAWRHNVRAISLTLEAARSMDRHGGSQGQQYGAFAQLGPGSPDAAPSHMTIDAARDTLLALVGDDRPDADNSDAALVRRARAHTHPDRRGGDRKGWDQVEELARVLGVLG